MMDAKRIEEIRQRVGRARSFKVASFPEWFERQTHRQVVEDAAELLTEVEWMRKELAQRHRQIELADEQLTRYGDVKRKLHELQDFIYPDKIEHFRKGETR